MRRLKIDLKSVCQQEASVRDNILFIKKKKTLVKKNNFFQVPPMPDAAKSYDDSKEAGRQMSPVLAVKRLLY